MSPQLWDSTTPLATSKLHTVNHNKTLICLMFNFSANELGSASEPSTVFMQILSHTVIRTTHKTNLIYRKLLFPLSILPTVFNWRSLLFPCASPTIYRTGETMRI